MSFEKVNPNHPDKVADRIAGAIVDLAYKKQDNPKIAVEVLIGHGNCTIIAESSVHLEHGDVLSIVDRITGAKTIDKPRWIDVEYLEVPQDPELAKNQAERIKCGDNGIFKGVQTSQEERDLRKLVRGLYVKWPTDGKFIYDKKAGTVIACQSNASSTEVAMAINEAIGGAGKIIVNPLGDWTGGTNVDTGATNRKLGSDMGRAVTGGGLHGKDLSKADVSVNIVCYLLAQLYCTTVDAFCAIGDEEITFTLHRTGKETVERVISYAEVVEMARNYIYELGGFEKLAEWGLI